LLLMLAEAEVEAGTLENARAIVNEIRTRAGVRVQGPGTDAASIAVPITDPRVAAYANYRIGTYTAPWTSQTVARNAVRDERRLELAMEGQRFFDLRRWGIAETVLNAHNAVERTRRSQFASASTFAARHALFPIPQIQIQLSKGKGVGLTQNTGW
jgi:starch-binding outer membrane protein, SusD/RagB family